MEITPAELLFGEPKLIFENCNQGSVYGTGTVNYQNFEAIKEVYEELITALKKDIQSKDEIISMLKLHTGVKN